MKRNITLAATAILALTAAQSMAQSRTGYFSDSYIYRHQMNPAMANPDSYFTIPMLGNMNMTAGMNFGVENLVMPGKNGQLVTFMHKDIDANKFLSDLPDQSKLLENLNLTLFSCGWSAFGGYNTLELNLHQKAGVSVPKEFFAFMKEMKDGKTYNFDLGAKMLAYGELAIGHSHAINEYLRVGGKLKFLVGAAYMNLDLNDCNASISHDAWKMNLKGSLDAVVGESSFKTDKEKNVEGFDVDSYRLGNYGFAVDLGATYDFEELVEGLKVSTAITDLGFINFEECNYAYNDGKPFTFNGFSQLGMHGGENGIEDQWDDIHDDLDNMMNLKVGARRKVKENLSATFTTGVEYEMPFYRGLSVGMLYTHHFGDLYAYNELRNTINYAPSRVFDVALSGAFTTYGFSTGALLNVHVSGISFFVGTDHLYTGKVNRNHIPLQKGAFDVQVGLCIPLGIKEADD